MSEVRRVRFGTITPCAPPDPNRLRTIAEIFAWTGADPEPHIGRRRARAFYTDRRGVVTFDDDWIKEEQDEANADPEIQLARAIALAGRNDRCPCGSGTKFKRCHGKGA